MKIGFFYDFDLTLTEEFQQYPIFRAYAEALKKIHGINAPHEYWKLCSRSELGVSWMEQMVRDTPGVFGRLTNERLEREFAPQIQLSLGIPSWFDRIGRFVDEEIHAQAKHHIITVGVLPLVRGSLVGPCVDSVSAGEFIDEGEGICRIKSILYPFRKVEIIKQLCKGTDLYSDIKWDDYSINHADSFVFGDGQSDRDMFRYVLQRGGVPVAVFEKGNAAAYKKAVEQLGSSVTIIAPRDYTEGSTLDRLIKEALLNMRENQCDMDPELVHNYHMNHVKNPKIIEVIKDHLSGCRYCRDHRQKRFYES